MKRSDLLARLTALEAIPVPVAIDEEAEAQREKARAALLEKMKDPHRVRREYEAHPAPRV